MDYNFFLLGEFFDSIVDDIALGVVVVNEKVDEGLEHFLELTVVLQWGEMVNEEIEIFLGLGAFVEAEFYHLWTYPFFILGLFLSWCWE